MDETNIVEPRLSSIGPCRLEWPMQAVKQAGEVGCKRESAAGMSSLSTVSCCIQFLAK